MIDDRDLAWYLRNAGCCYLHVQCGDCNLSCCYKDDKGKVKRELRDRAIRWMYNSGYMKPRIIAELMHISIWMVNKAVRDGNNS